MGGREGEQEWGEVILVVCLNGSDRCIRVCTTVCMCSSAHVSPCVCACPARTDLRPCTSPRRLPYAKCEGTVVVVAPSGCTDMARDIPALDAADGGEIEGEIRGERMRSRQSQQRGVGDCKKYARGKCTCVVACIHTLRSRMNM